MKKYKLSWAEADKDRKGDELGLFFREYIKSNFPLPDSLFDRIKSLTGECHGEVGARVVERVCSSKIAIDSCCPDCSAHLLGKIVSILGERLGSREKREVFININSSVSAQGGEPKNNGVLAAS